MLKLFLFPGRCAFFKVKPEHAMALEQLKVLDIGRCFFVADAEVKPFPRLPQLQELYLEVTQHSIESRAYKPGSPMNPRRNSILVVSRDVRSLIRNNTLPIS